MWTHYCVDVVVEAPAPKAYYRVTLASTYNLLGVGGKDLEGRGRTFKYVAAPLCKEDTAGLRRSRGDCVVVVA